MAVAAPEIAEGLSPEASEAVSAAAAGRGRRLTPEVAKELKRRASRKPKVASQPAAPSSSGGGGGSRATAAFNALPAAGSSKAAKVITRGILAFGAFLLALELASYVSGRYFTWDLHKGVSGAQQAAKSLDLYPGQTAKLAARNLPVGSGQAAGFVGTKAL